MIEELKNTRERLCQYKHDAIKATDEMHNTDPLLANIRFYAGMAEGYTHAITLLDDLIDKYEEVKSGD
jgi:hypothetical protein